MKQINRLLFNPLLSLVLICLSIGLGGCITTGLPVAVSSPWKAVNLNTNASPLDVSFIDSEHGFLVGSNRLILETNDGGVTWAKRALDLPEEENFRLISVSFKNEEGWIAGQPGLILHTINNGKDWTRLFLDTKLPGEPYLITSLGGNHAELATNVGAIYETRDGGSSWQASVNDAAGAVRDLRRGPDGSYVSVSSLGNFFATWTPGQDVWQVHQRVSSQRLQSIGYQPDANLWMITRGAQIRFNNSPGDLENWSNPLIPITNGYGYLDMAWDPEGTIWIGGGNGTLLKSSDDGKTWERDPIGSGEATNFTRILFPRKNKGFVLGERGHLLSWIESK
uniref:Photosystem II assembly protein Ycf48 n=1 Tax=Paulinella chromatophora TaxID=39717 RepID=B1X4R0_PAUCH|nr:plant photosystem II stability/assembly factor- like protein [Paulinella chromatophora]ACB42929.1 plant photosystem II stability/assembly factor- like protein [Paulinella chromatophora]